MELWDPHTLTHVPDDLPDALTTHVAYAEVAVPPKQLSVQVQNFDYDRSN